MSLSSVECRPRARTQNVRNLDSHDLQATPLVLVRHGQARSSGTGFYGPDAPLTGLGHRQAAALAASLDSASAVDAVYSSNLPRAVETAAAVAKRLGLVVVEDRRLAEFDVDLGPAQSSDGRPDLLAWHPDHAGVDGETLAQFASRVAEFHDEIVERHPAQRVAVVCHAGTIDAALRWSLGISPQCPWQYEFEVQNASITEIEYWP